MRRQTFRATAKPLNGVRSTTRRFSRAKALLASVAACGDGSPALSLTIKNVAAPSIDVSIAAKNGSSRGPRIRCAATPFAFDIGSPFGGRSGVSAAYANSAAMLRLAVDARVVADDTR